VSVRSLNAPVIDVARLSECEATGDSWPDADAHRELAACCAEYGAFHVVGHGIPLEHLREFDTAMRRFFALERDTKQQVGRTRDNARGFYDEELTKNRPDWKEVFDYGAERESDSRDASHSDGTNQWPAGLPGFRSALLRHYADCERVGLLLVRALCTSLGLEPTRLDAALSGHSSFVRLNHYAPCDDAAPADAALFPESGKLGVHLADMLQVWSNDRYRSPLHRVIADPLRDRYSAPFFLNPAYDAVCAPFADLIGPAAPARYRPVSWSHFRDQRSAGDYADYGHEIQIEDFRIDPGSPGDGV